MIDDYKFNIAIEITGDILVTYVFTSEYGAQGWLNSKVYKDLCNKYTIKYNMYWLDGLVLGDKCQVLGEGCTVYEILGFIKYADNRYGVLLDSGEYEEVHKCYKEFVVSEDET